MSHFCLSPCFVIHFQDHEGGFVLTSIVGVVILLGGLIFFHEFGHYSIAKLFGVKVEVFSLGFGKKIFQKKWGETEYCVSLFPLGGYVKLMGDDPYKGVPAHEADRAFSTQKLYKRFAIVAAGPIANLLLAYFLYSIVFWTGQPVMGNRLGAVAVQSQAWEAGLRPKDRVLEVQGTKIENWSQLEEFLRAREGEKVDVKVDRAGTELHMTVPVARVKVKNAFGEDEEVGGFKGIAPTPLASVIGISNPKSIAYQAGLRTGDEIVKLETHAITVFDDLNEALLAVWKKEGPLTVTYKRRAAIDKIDKKDVLEQSITLPLPKPPGQMGMLGATEVLGIYPSDVFVRQLTPDSPAEKGGLQVGDRIAKIGQTPIYNFETIVEQVQSYGAKSEPVPMVLEREGQEVTLGLTPIQTIQEDPLTRQTYKKYLVGFAPATNLREPELTVLKIRDPLRLIPHAIGETNLRAKQMVISIVKLVKGEISAKNLGGPVLIASVAGRSLDAGIIPFLQMMALISINLFLLNLFPVPVLDGGHLLFFSIEALKGKPVSIRTMEVANQVGMAFILLLVVFTLYNDISRILIH